jgi:hypothetical protein
MPFLYLECLWDDVIARMGGLMSLAFTIAGVYSTWFSGDTGAGHARDYFWAGAVLCFLFANYRIWANEHAKVVSSRPDILVIPEQINWEPGPSGGTVLIFAVSLLNRGAATVTTGWGGTIQFGTGNPENLAPFLITSSWLISIGGQQVTLHPRDQIQAKTMERRLETGEGRTGRVFFTLAGDRINQLQAANFTAKVYCHDFVGKRAEGIFRPHGPLVTGVAVYPGEEGSIIEPTAGAQAPAALQPGPPGA